MLLFPLAPLPAIQLILSAVGGWFNATVTLSFKAVVTGSCWSVCHDLKKTAPVSNRCVSGAINSSCVM